MGNIVVPQLGESVVEARVARWLKKQGDRVEAGEPVVELETEKIDLEVGAEHAGVISRIERQEGEDVKVGELLAVVDEAGAAGSPPVPTAKESRAPVVAPAAEAADPPSRLISPCRSPCRPACSGSTRRVRPNGGASSDVEAPPNDCPPPARSAADGGDADDVQ